MNRGALGYIVTRKGIDGPPFIASCNTKQQPDGYRVLVDDGSGGHWYPKKGLAAATETDDSLELDYPVSAGHFGESGIQIQPVTVDGWNDLAKVRPEMKPVFDFDDMAERLRGL